MKRLFFILFLCSTCYAQFSDTKPILGEQIRNWPQGLVGYWLLNEGTGTQVNDLSGNGINGTFANEVTWVPGIAGPCVNFAGITDYITLGLPKGITTDVTIVVQFRMDTLFDSYAVPIRLLDMAIRYGAEPQIRWYPDVDTTVVNKTFTLDLNKWHTLAITQSGTVCCMYVNGVCIHTAEAVPIDVVSTSCFLGNFNGTGTWDLDGQINYCQVYNRALTPSEIAQLYCDPHWMFREEPSSMWVTAGGEPPAVGSVRVYIIAKAATPILLPLGIILSMAAMMRRERKATPTKGSSIC